MNYKLYFTKQAQNNIDFHKKSGNKAIIKKIFIILDELSKNPFLGTGKPEALKYSLVGKWSRRINQEHRLIYEIDNHVVIIHSVLGHYE